MLLHKKILICLALLGLTLMGGCALSPQQLTPNPIVADDSLPVIGRGQAINVRIIDGRSKEILGSRGGLYANTSNVSVAKDFLSKRLQTRTEDALRRMGFVAGSNNPNAKTMTITISELTYDTEKGYVITSINVSSVLRIQLQAAGKIYNGRYSANVQQDFASAPSLEQNNELVAEVIANALKRMLQDTELMSKL